MVASLQLEEGGAPLLVRPRDVGPPVEGMAPLGHEEIEGVAAQARRGR